MINEVSITIPFYIALVPQLSMRYSAFVQFVKFSDY